MKRGPKLPSLDEFRFRFWGQMKQVGFCWIWTGAKCTRGYGQINFLGKYQLAHRVAWMIHARREPRPIPPGKWILHRCDTPACIRPSHLYCGTPLDDAVDARERRYGRRGRIGPDRSVAGGKGVSL